MSGDIQKYEAPDFEPTIVVVAKRSPEGLSPKEKGELMRTLNNRIGPMVKEAFDAASTGYLEWNDDRWEVALGWFLGPLRREILYGPCKGCGHGLEHHRNDNGGKPCDGGGGVCGHAPFEASVDAERRAKLFPIFELLGKGKDTGELDNPFAKALVFAFAQTFRATLGNALDWMGVKKLDKEPEDIGAGLPVLPPGS